MEKKNDCKARKLCGHFKIKLLPIGSRPANSFVYVMRRIDLDVFRSTINTTRERLYRGLSVWSTINTTRERLYRGLSVFQYTINTFRESWGAFD